MGLASFPDPYYEELLYSAFARFTDQLPNLTTSAITRLLFGDEDVNASYDLPHHLHQFIERLPSSSTYTIESVIQHHTLLPYYAPFQHVDDLKILYEAMVYGGDKGWHQRLGKSSSSIKHPDYFRFCPVCVGNEIADFGEAYWHREHQLPGVEVCSEHHARLEKSTAKIQQPDPRIYIAAQQHVNRVSGWYASEDDTYQRHLIHIAHDSQWLIRSEPFHIDFGCLEARIERLVKENGYLNEKGRLRRLELSRDFIARFSDHLLRRFGCDFKNHNTNWFINIVSDNHSRQPLQYILTARFFDCDLESLLLDCLKRNQIFQT